MVKQINLASGQRPFPHPWINIDLRDQGYPIDIITNANDLSMFDDGSVDIIVAHHLVEHIAIQELSNFVREWRRVLKIGGRLAVSVPNLKVLAAAWAQGKIDAFIYNVNCYGADQGYEYDLHRWGYDQQELIDRISGTSQGMEEFAWANIRILQPHHTTSGVYFGSNIAYDWWILCMEFTNAIFEGVYREKGDYRPWVSFIEEDGKKTILGKFNSESEAARVSKAAYEERKEEENV